MAQDPYLVLARKWRPQTFEDVIGQDHITRTLQNAIRSGRIGHAYLFIGTRGIGKTTTARILAKALNCTAVDAPTPAPCDQCGNCRSIAAGNSIDVVEIDGASNNSVDHVREIRENIRLVPSSSRYKIYIIDEVHQLSQSAFNALLKTLEEPPEHAVFVLATTEAHKVPATIVSRCQRYDFRRVGQENISDLLRAILDAEGVRCEEEALVAIARAADGSVRDGESILEQLISYCGDSISFADVFDVLGLVDWQVLNDLCDAILDKDTAGQLRIVEQVVVSGKDLSQFVQDILRYFRNLLVCKTADPNELITLPADDIAAMAARAKRLSLTEVIRLVEQFAELSKDFDSQLAQRIALESLLIRISKVAVEVSVETVLEKLVGLGLGGVGPPAEGYSRPAPSVDSANPSAAASRTAPEQRAAAEPAQAASEGEAATRGADRISLTSQNMRRHWTDIAHRVSARNLNLGVALGHATPAAIEEDTLVLRFAPHHDRAKRLVEGHEQRRIIGETLAAATENIASIRTEMNGEIPEDAADEHAVGRSAAPSVRPEVEQLALQDPHIAQVIEVFRGTIVDVTHRTGPA